MPEFCYQAIDKQGRHLSGSMPAMDESDLHKKLKALGLWLAESELKRNAQNADANTDTGAAPKKARLAVPGFGKKVKRRELVDFCTLLTFQIRAGVPLVQALQATAEDCTDKDFRVVINKLQQHIESGMELHEALARFPDVFDAHFISVVHAGVISDKLPEILETMKKYLEWMDQVMGEVRQAAMYPSIVLLVVAGFTGFLFTFIIPKFAKLLTSVHVPQPMLTQVVLGISSMARATWWIWLPLVIGLLLTVPLGRRYSPRFAMAMDRWKLQLPVFGPINLMLALSRFSHNLAILYQSGIPILEALNQCQHGLIGNLYVEEAVGKMANDIKTGSTISEAMHRQQVFSAMLVRMVALGETTGRLDSALITCGDYYDVTIPPRIKKLFAMLEPALMLFIIGLVGAVALAIYLPILSLMNSIK
jgi:type IV pilus assembly protein PilC